MFASSFYAFTFFTLSPYISLKERSMSLLIVRIPELTDSVCWSRHPEMHTQQNLMASNERLVLLDNRTTWWMNVWMKRVDLGLSLSQCCVEALALRNMATADLTMTHQFYELESGLDCHGFVKWHALYFFLYFFFLLLHHWSLTFCPHFLQLLLPWSHFQFSCWHDSSPRLLTHLHLFRLLSDFRLYTIINCM